MLTHSARRLLCWAAIYVLGFPPLAAVGQMQYPLSVTANTDGEIFVADRNLPGVWKIVDGQAEIFFQGSRTFRTPLNAIRCVMLDEKGRLLAGDSSTRDVYRFDADRKPVPLTNGSIGIPMAIAVATTGELYVADLELHRIWKVPALGGKPEEFAVIRAPRGLAIDAENRLFVVSHGDNQILRVDPDGTQHVVVKDRPFDFPHQLVIHPEQGIFVVDGYAKTVWKVASDGTIDTLVSGDPLLNPVGLAGGAQGLYIADPRRKAIYACDFDGKLTTVFTSKSD